MKPSQAPAVANSGNGYDSSDPNLLHDPIAEARLQLLEQMWADDDGMALPRSEAVEDSGEPASGYFSDLISLEWSIRPTVIAIALLIVFVVGVLLSAAIVLTA